MHHHNKRKFTPTIFTGVLTLLTIMSGLLLSAPRSFADSSAAVNINLTVEAACALTVTSGSNLSTIIRPGDDGLIGVTGLKAACNDPGGLAIYAIGYTGNIHGDNNLRLEESGNTLSSTNLIPTGVAASPTNSQWNMTVAADTSAQSTFTPTIPAEFQSTHIVPTTQAQIASYPSTTDQTTGVNIKVTYNAHISVSQAAGTYKGKVKYTLVHPSLHAAPASRPATLDTGVTVNSKMKTLAASVVDGTTSTVSYVTSDSYIKAIEVHTNISSLPSGLTPSEANTISSSASQPPIYIVFDNTNDAGIMHFYTMGDEIALPEDAAYMFYGMVYLNSFSGLNDWNTSATTRMDSMFSSAGYNATAFSLNISDWDTSQVTNMNNMFSSAGYSATTWSIGDLSGWDTSKVTGMAAMFNYAGYSATTWSIGDLSSWKTSEVENMNFMFAYAGYNATTWSIGNLSDWDTSKVTYMDQLFCNAGYNATTWSIGDLSGWDTSKVTSMTSMFSSAGRSATTWSIGDLSNWDTSRVTSMNGAFANAGRSATTFSLDLSGWNTSQVTNMGNMFVNAGYNATTWSVIIPQTNGNGINNTTSRIYGKTTSTYQGPPSGRSFTLAQ